MSAGVPPKTTPTSGRPLHTQFRRTFKNYCDFFQNSYHSKCQREWLSSEIDQELRGGVIAQRTSESSMRSQRNNAQLRRMQCDYGNRTRPRPAFLIEEEPLGRHIGTNPRALN